MNKVAKIFSYIAFVFAFCCMAIGYAAVQDELIVNGTVSVNGYFLKTDVSAADTEAYELKDGALIISPTYYDPDEKKNYRVTGIAEEGFSATALTTAQKVDPTNVLSISIPKEVAIIGENAFSKLANITSFTVDAENTAFKAVDGVLFNIDGTTLVRYPSNRQSGFYIVPPTVTEIRSGAFDGAEECTAIVTDLYNTSAWGSPGAVMINSTEFSGTVTSVDRSVEGDYTVYLGGSVEVNDPVVLQGNDDPEADIWGTPSDVIIASDTENRLFINVSAALCSPLANGHYAQVYVSSWKSIAYGYLNGDTLEIHNCRTAVVGGEVYQWYSDTGHRVLLDNTVYRLPSGTVDGSESLPEEFADWSSIKAQVKKVDVIDNIAPKSVKNWFKDMTNCTQMELGKLGTENVNDMSYMFSGCSNLESIDLIGFNTTDVTNMRNMFASCKKLKSLDVTHFDTQNVTNMQYMFSACTSLTELDVSNLNTSKAQYINNMFSGCTNLKALDVSTFDTSNTTHMHQMFVECTSLTSLNLTGFKTIGAKSMYMMFATCPNLTELDLGGFDTSQAASLYYMFHGCSGLTKLDLSSFNTKKVSDMTNMFNDCSALEKIIVSENFVTTNVASADSKNMFTNCKKLKGGNDTIYNSAYVRKTYASIDGANGQPGYFTAKVGTASPVTLTVTVDENVATGYTVPTWNYPKKDTIVTLNSPVEGLSEVLLTCGEATATAIVTDGVFTIPAAFVTDGAIIKVTVPNSEAVE